MMLALVDLVRMASGLLSLVIFVRVILSWVSPGLSNPLVAMVYRLTEPILRPVRDLLPATGGIDFSPLLVLIGIQILERVLIRVLITLA